MSHLTIEDSIIEKYFSFLTKLDIGSKKQLIKVLKESISAKKNSDFDIASLFGAWVDDRDSDTIIREIRNSRIEKKIFEKL